MILPYILSILKNSGDLQSIPTLCYKVAQFEANSRLSEDAMKQAVIESLQQGIEMGLIRENKERKLYGLPHGWYTPESTAFQISLHEVVQNMPQALVEESPETMETEIGQTQNPQVTPQDDCGPGMAQQRSPAQKRAIAIYRRMRAEREQAAREQATTKRSQGGRRSRSRTRSSSRGRARSRSGTRRTSATNSRSMARSTPRSRSRSKSQSKRQSYTPVATRKRRRS